MTGENLLITPEDIESEQLFLLDIQANHAQEMDAIGITEKALQLLPNAPLNDLSKPFVTVSEFKGKDGTADSLYLRFITPKLSTNSTTLSYSPDIHVANVYENSVELDHESDFTFTQVEAMRLMVDGLKQARDLGVLSHLSFAGKTAQILNPIHQMTSNPTKSGRRRLPM